MRSLTSYAKVQAAVGKLVRNRRSQLRQRHVRECRLLNVGCGPNTYSNFINLDFLWRPGVDICWNLERGLPFESATIDGIFAEHCLEHFALASARRLLCEFRRVLRLGGTVRLIVPDAELYIDTYSKRRAGLETKFPFEGRGDQFEGIYAPLLSVNRVWYQDRESAYGHCCMYDFDLLARLLAHCGFGTVRRQSFGIGEDRALLIDSEQRAPESLYVEALATGDTDHL